MARVLFWIGEAQAGRLPGNLGDLLSPGGLGLAGDGPDHRPPETVGEAAQVVLGTLVDLAIGPGVQSKDRLAAVRLLLQVGMLSSDAQETQETAQGPAASHTLVLTGAAGDRVAALLAARLGEPGSPGVRVAGGPGGERVAEESDHPDTMVVSGACGGGSPRSQVSGPQATDSPGVLEGTWRDLIPGLGLPEVTGAPADAPPEGPPAAAGGPGGGLAQEEIALAEETQGDLGAGGETRGPCPGCGWDHGHREGCPKAAEELR